MKQAPLVGVSTEQQAEEHTQSGKTKQRPERCGLFRGGTRAGGQDRPARPNALHRVLHPPTLGFLRPYPMWPNRTRLASLIIVQTRALTPYITGVSHSDEVRSDGTDDAGSRHQSVVPAAPV
jgi:hypothetical protein